jgi:hypothetical protein
MLKQRNGKLLTLGILALFLVSLIPVTATAAPTKIHDAVYLVTTWPPVYDDKCGRIAIDLESGEYSLRCKDVPQSNDFYYLEFCDENNSGLCYPIDENLNSDSRGVLISSGTVMAITALNWMIDHGYDIVFKITED